MLDKRLSVCAELVSGERVCDIGTDHAYLVAELLKSGRCKTAVAADINEGPLAAAKATLEKYGVADRANIILSDGLKNIPPDGITDVVIAGMGAELIAEIISGCEWIKNEISLILQPMTHTPYLRKWLYENGFEILKETAVVDDRYCYAVMKAVYCGITTETDQVTENIGTADLSLPDTRIYVLKQYERIYKVGKSLAEAGKETEVIPYLALADKIKAILTESNERSK